MWRLIHWENYFVLISALYLWRTLSKSALTRTLQICRFFSPSFGGRMASAFSLVKSRSLYLVIGPMWQKFILLTIPHYSKIDWPLTLFCTRSPPFMSSDVIFLQAKWSKIKERVEGWKSGKTSRFKRITVCRGCNQLSDVIGSSHATSIKIGGCPCKLYQP